MSARVLGSLSFHLPAPSSKVISPLVISRPSLSLLQVVQVPTIFPSSYLIYSSLFFFIREIFYGWCLRYLHSSGASFVFLFLFLHLGRAISYGSYFYNPNTWFSGIILFFLLMAIAFMGYVLPFGQMSFWGATEKKKKEQFLKTK